MSEFYFRDGSASNGDSLSSPWSKILSSALNAWISFSRQLDIWFRIDLYQFLDSSDREALPL